MELLLLLNLREIVRTVHGVPGDLLPQLLQTGYSKNIPDEPSLYMAKDIKRIGQTELNKTCFSRMVGAIFSGRHCFAVYNTRDAAMKWSGLGEFKTQQNLKSIAGANAQINAVDSSGRV